MVRTLVFDKVVNEAFKQLLDKNESNSGLLLGCIDESNDYILHVIRTPVDTESQSKQLYDENWIVNHALQIHDLLIGGVDILGLYCIDIQAANARQLLNKIFKSLNDFPYYKQMNFNADRILFQVDSVSKNVLMKTIDVSNPKSTAQKCDMTVQDDLLGDFYTISSNYDMNSVFTMPNVYNHELLKRHFYSALSTEFMFEKNRFLCLINNCLFSDDKKFSDLLPVLRNKSKSRLNDSELDNSLCAANEASEQLFDETGNAFTASLLENLSNSPVKGARSEDLAQNLDSIYHVTGVCSSVIYFHKSANIKSIKRKLIYDIMRSLFARLRLLTDDLDARKDIIGDAQLEDPNAVEEAYQTPNRIYIKTNNKRFLLSDYVFPDETSADIVERIRELFNYEIQDPQTQIIHVEKFPPEIQNLQNDLDDANCPTIDIEHKQQQHASSDTNNTTNVATTSRLLLKYTIPFVVAIIAFFLSFWILNSTNIKKEKN